MPSKDTIAKIMRRVDRAVAEKQAAVTATHSREVHDDGEEYVPVGLNGVLAATENLLAVNRGLRPPDERDSSQFKKTFRTHQLAAERIRLDAGKLRRSLMYRAAKTRNLQGVHSFYFDPYFEGQLLSNPLSAPLEEINPLQLVEQSRRITLMGPGGLGSAQSITEDAQALRPDSFGYQCVLSGPECFDAESEVYTQRGWIPWPEVADDDIFACNVNGTLEWHKADRIVRESYAGPLIVAESKTLRMAITPNHRVITRFGHPRTAAEVYGRAIQVPIRHAPHTGDPAFTHFQLPSVEHGSNAQKAFGPFLIDDWCELVGWFLSEGSICHDGKRGSSVVRIHQSDSANPDKVERIRQLFDDMGITASYSHKAFHISAKQIVAWFLQYDEGCYNKWIPEELQSAPVSARKRLLESLILGDGRNPKNRLCYCTVSRRLAQDVERLAVGLGYTAFIRIEQDRRPHIKTTNYVVSLHRDFFRTISNTVGAIWREESYSGMVYCATVPGGQLHVRGKNTTSGIWSGNSERIGIDTRVSWGTKIGSNGRLYQKYRNKHTGRMQWMSPEDLDGLTVGLPP